MAHFLWTGAVRQVHFRRGAPHTERATGDFGQTEMGWANYLRYDFAASGHEDAAKRIMIHPGDGAKDYSLRRRGTPDAAKLLQRHPWAAAIVQYMCDHSQVRQAADLLRHMTLVENGERGQSAQDSCCMC